MPTSIAELAEYRGATEHSEAEYARVGLAYVGGCHRCGVLLDNPTLAYPSIYGVWCCANCIADHGYEEVDIANLKIFGRLLPGEVVLDGERREVVRRMYHALRAVNEAELLGISALVLTKVRDAVASADELLVGI